MGSGSNQLRDPKLKSPFDYVQQSGLAFRPIVFLGFCPKTQKPMTQANSTFGSLFMRHPKTIDRERKPIFYSTQKFKNLSIFTKNPKTQKPKNPKPKTPKSRPKQNEIFWGFCHPCSLCLCVCREFRIVSSRQKRSGTDPTTI